LIAINNYNTKKGYNKGNNSQESNNKTGIFLTLNWPYPKDISKEKLKKKVESIRQVLNREKRKREKNNKKHSWKNTGIAIGGSPYSAKEYLTNNKHEENNRWTIRAPKKTGNKGQQEWKLYKADKLIKYKPHIHILILGKKCGQVKDRLIDYWKRVNEKITKKATGKKFKITRKDLLLSNLVFYRDIYNKKEIIKVLNYNINQSLEYKTINFWYDYKYNEKYKKYIFSKNKKHPDWKKDKEKNWVK